MSLLEIQNDPDYVNANAATKQAIFDAYSKDDPDYTGANPATQNAIRESFGLSKSTARAPRTAGEDLAPVLAPAAIAAVPAIAAGANAIGQGVRTAGQIAAPAFGAVGDLAKTYVTRPGAAFVDLAAGSMGLPPPNATQSAYTGLGQTYKNAVDYTNKAGQFAPKTPTTFTGGVNPAFDAALSRPYTPPEPPTAGNFIQRMSQLAQRYSPTARTVGAVAVPSVVAGGGAALSNQAARQVQAMTPEQRRQLYSSPMMGAMSGDAGFASAIMNAGQQ